jgi:hypothetical protein
MAELSTLVTVVTADMSGFSAGMSEGVKEAKNFERNVNDSIDKVKSHAKGMGNPLGEFEHGLHGVTSSLRGFREVTELAFGFHVGRMFFEKVHEAFVKFGEGVSDAIKDGEDFGHALEDGAKHLLGMETHAEALARHMKESAAAAKTLSAMQDIKEGLEDKGEKSPWDAHADAEVEKAEKLQKKLNEDAREGRNKIAALTANRAETAASFGGEDSVQNQLASSAGGGTAYYDKQLEAAHKEYDAKIIEAEQGEDRLKEIRKSADDYREREENKAHEKHLDDLSKWADEQAHEEAEAEKKIEDEKKKVREEAKREEQQRREKENQEIRKNTEADRRAWLEDEKKAEQISPQKKFQAGKDEADRLYKEGLIGDEDYKKRVGGLEHDLHGKPEISGLEDVFNQLQKSVTGDTAEQQLAELKKTAEATQKTAVSIEELSGKLQASGGFEVGANA